MTRATAQMPDPDGNDETRKEESSATETVIDLSIDVVDPPPKHASDPVGGRPVYVDTATEEEKARLDPNYIDDVLDAPDPPPTWEQFQAVVAENSRLRLTVDSMQMGLGPAALPPGIQPSSAARKAIEALPEEIDVDKLLEVDEQARSLRQSQVDATRDNLEGSSADEVAAWVIGKVRRLRQNLYVNMNEASAKETLAHLLHVELALDTRAWYKEESPKSRRALRSAQKRIDKLRDTIHKTVF